MSQEKQLGSWAGVRKNVDYLGCSADGAKIHPELAGAENFYLGKKQRPKFDPLPVTDPRFPQERRDYSKHWGDGPSRLMESMEPAELTPENDPRKLPLHEALRRCYDLAHTRNKRYFALQNGGLCFATDRKDFLQFGLLDPSECTTCQKTCPVHSRPCGPTCAKKKGKKCAHPFHSACAHGDAVNQSKNIKGGGVFTNSVYQIKDMGFDEKKTPALNDQGDAFEAFRYPELKIGDQMDCERTKDGFFDLNPDQLYLPDHFNPTSPIKGLLKNASAGSGKTCSALAVLPAFMEAGWLVIWVTRDSLKHVPNQNLYRDICMVKVRQLIDSDQPITLANGEVLARTRDEKIAFVRSDRGKVVLKRYGIELDQQFILSYDELVKMIVGKGAQRRLAELLRARSPNGDMVWRVVFVFDEAHNFVSQSLPREERQELDRRFDRVTISGQTFRTLGEVYGRHVPVDPSARLHGRDLVAALCFRSYHLSGADSVKMLKLTGTPMSTSPTDQFWLMNLGIEDPRQRLSMKLDEYYDKATFQLKEEALIRFAAAAHGRLSYLDASRDATRLARKVFAGVHETAIQPFHQRLIDGAIAEAKKQPGGLTTERVHTVFNTVGICARVKGPFFTAAEIEEYERELTRSGDQTPEQEAKYQGDRYDREAPRVRRLLGLGPGAEDEIRYAKKAEQFRRWMEKRKSAALPAALRDVVVGSPPLLLSLAEWWEGKQKKKKTKTTKTKKAVPPADRKFVETDPKTGAMRMLSRAEFVERQRLGPTLDGPETRKNLSLLMTDRHFDAASVRQVLPYYAPTIHDCVQRIIEMERKARAQFGHGMRHIVFMYGVAGKRDWTSSYGARIVASAFHAYSEQFRVLLVYTGGKLRWDLPKTRGPKHHHQGEEKRWGVAVMSSRPIRNIYHGQYGGNKEVDYNRKTLLATQETFNSPENTHGDHIKVMVLDGAYMEGVDFGDIAVTHFLGVPLSRAQIEQSASRGVRTCRSTHLPFYRGVGALSEMHFYGSTSADPTRPDLYSQMMSHLSQDELVRVNLIDVFTELSQNFSIDYWLNVNINRFNPLYRGRVVNFYHRWNQAYRVEMRLKRDGTKKEKEEEESHEFIVDAESVRSAFRTGDRVVDDAARPAVVESQGNNSQDVVIRYDDDRTTVHKQVRYLRFRPGTEIEFHLPYGVDLAQKVLNIADYAALHPSDLQEDLFQDLRIPSAAVQSVETGFRHDLTFCLLGYVALLRSTLAATERPLHVRVVLPDTRDDDRQPTMSELAMEWSCDPTTEGSVSRVLTYDERLLRDFLAPREGLSLIMLSLTGTRCGSSQGAGRSHTNLLLYTPEWQTVERFDPMGYTAHWYDSVALDRRLEQLFDGHGLRYLNSAETCPLIGMQRTQEAEQIDPHSFCQTFALFYLHMRLLHTPERMPESVTTFPWRFQRALVTALGQQVEGTMTDYIRAYATQVQQSREHVIQDSIYREELPFWTNCVRVIRHLEQRLTTSRRHGKGKGKGKKEEAPEEPIWRRLRGLFDGVLG